MEHLKEKGNIHYENAGHILIRGVKPIATNVILKPSNSENDPDQLKV